jgi:DNA processing protein
MNAAKTLARRGFTVLTGGTTSSDKAAAEGALGAGGGCALFLAEGILKNKQPMAVLEKTSDDNWLVVSRFHPQRPQTRSDAALRNDLIFMAADAILLTQVIQSGSIFNAALTSLKRKKHVFVLDPDFLQRDTVGNRILIEAGATVLRASNEYMEPDMKELIKVANMP